MGLRHETAPDERDSRTVAAGRRSARLAVATGAIAALVSGALCLALARHRFFQLDEFVFTRAAWLIAEGQVPYRDFFEHHTPLFYALLAPIVGLAPEDSAALLWARFACLPILGLLLWAVFALGRHFAGRAAGAVATLVLGAMPAFLSRAIEIRPDLLAAAAFLWATWLLVRARPSELASRLLSGALIGVALLSTQKAAHFVWGLPLAALLEPLWLRQRGGRPWLAAAAPTVGLAASGGILAAALAAFGAWPDFYNQNVELALLWQGAGGGFSAAGYLLPALAGAPVWTALAGTGVLVFAVRLCRRSSPTRREEVLLVAAALPAALSLVTLPIPWPYNFLPVFAIWTPFAAGAARALVARLTSPRLARTALLALGLVAVTLEARWWLAERQRDNGLQRALVDRALALTPREAAAFDSNGGYLFRPAAYFLWYHSGAMRALLRAQLEREMVPAIAASGAPLFLHDPRFEELPASVRAWVQGHYQRYFGPIHLLGAELAPAAPGPAESYEISFRALRSGHYFVVARADLEPRSWRVTVGDQTREPRVPFELTAGEHRVRVEKPGAAPAPFLLWLPATGETWYPGAGAGISLYPFFF